MLGGATVVRALGGDVESKDVVVDVVVSPLADEPLISDRLAGALEIAVTLLRDCGGLDGSP